MAQMPREIWEMKLRSAPQARRMKWMKRKQPEHRHVPADVVWAFVVTPGKIHFIAKLFGLLIFTK